MPEPHKPHGARRWIRAVLLLVGTAGLFALLLRSLDLRALVASLQGARWGLVALAGAIALIACDGVCVLRLWALLGALPPAPETPDGAGPPTDWSSARGLRALLSIYLVTTAARNLLPALAGDALRTVQIHQHGYRVGATVAVQLVERIIDALSVSLLTLGVAVLGTLPHPLARPLWILAASGIGAAVALLVIGRLGWRWLRREPRAGSRGDAGDADPGGMTRLLARGRRALRGFLRSLAEGLHHLRRPHRLGVALGWSLLGGLADAGTAGLCLIAVGLSLPLHAWLLLVLVARASSLVPTTPGSLGVQEGAHVLALGLLGVPGEPALSFALLYHMAHLIPVTLVGMIEARRHL
jgi:hypothetical protein